MTVWSLSINRPWVAAVVCGARRWSHADRRSRTPRTVRANRCGSPAGKRCGMGNRSGGDLVLPDRRCLVAQIPKPSNPSARGRACRRRRASRPATLGIEAAAVGVARADGCQDRSRSRRCRSTGHARTSGSARSGGPAPSLTNRNRSTREPGGRATPDGSGLRRFARSYPPSGQSLRRSSGARCGSPSRAP